jgi:hypothetical protein
MPETIPCLSLWQPWATLMAIGAKRFETRGWRPPAGSLKPGDPLAIHAAKTADHITGLPLFEETGARKAIAEALTAAGYERIGREERRAVDGLPFEEFRISGVHWNVPLGAVLCIVRYEGACPTSHIEGSPVWREEERPLGDYSPGRFGWATSMLLRLPEPVPARGKQALWQWECPDELWAQLQPLLNGDDHA